MHIGGRAPINLCNLGYKSKNQRRNEIYETSVGADHSLLQILSSVSILHLSCGTQYVNIVSGYYDPHTSMATPGIPLTTGQSY